MVKIEERMRMNTQLKAMLASYLRSIIGAATTLYLAGVTDPADLAYSLIGALVPVASRYLNPKDAAFGRTPKVEEIEEALKDVKVVKAPVKKDPAPAKRPAGVTGTADSIERQLAAKKAANKKK